MRETAMVQTTWIDDFFPCERGRHPREKSRQKDRFGTEYKKLRNTAAFLQALYYSLSSRDRKRTFDGRYEEKL